jgi:hypothetical protein
MKKLLITILMLFAFVSVASAWDSDGWDKQQVPYAIKTAAPAVTDDDYPVPFLWADTTNDKVYILIDNTSGAAVWQEVLHSGGLIGADLIPDTDNAYDLGSTTKEWKDLWIDGTANIDAVAADAITEGGNAVPNSTDGLDFFAATTSAELLGVLSDETGTGSVVFANTPTLITPEIGAATGTSLSLTGTLLSTTGFAPSATTGAPTAYANDASIAVSYSIVRVAGDGGATVLDTDPAVADGGKDGQIVIIQGCSDTNTVQIADACNTQLSGGVAFTLGLGDTLMLVWDDGSSIWMELTRSDN